MNNNETKEADGVAAPNQQLGKMITGGLNYRDQR
jgi:hypothetical protein